MTLRGVVTLQTDLRANKAAEIIEFQTHNLWRSRRTPPGDLEARLKVNGKMWHRRPLRFIYIARLNGRLCLHGDHVAWSNQELRTNWWSSVCGAGLTVHATRLTTPD